MCGIVGYVGQRDAASVLMDGLSRLEYRGYDSAGIAVFENEIIKVAKSKGRLVDLQEKMNQEQASLIKISDSFKKIIVVNSNTPVWRNEQGILVMNMYDFLLNEESLDM